VAVIVEMTEKQNFCSLGMLERAGPLTPSAEEKPASCVV